MSDTPNVSAAEKARIRAVAQIKGLASALTRFLTVISGHNPRE